ncbi:hypothetical protein CGRA01v4_02800 [Colletotrichum graminicola]|nr:hypothetical protein CGRA01v4_02800 [Colletotrichum graminicola]
MAPSFGVLLNGPWLTLPPPKPTGHDGLGPSPGRSSSASPGIARPRFSQSPAAATPSSLMGWGGVMLHTRRRRVHETSVCRSATPPFIARGTCSLSVQVSSAANNRRLPFDDWFRRRPKY